MLYMIKNKDIAQEHMHTITSLSFKLRTKSQLKDRQIDFKASAHSFKRLLHGF